MSMTRSRIQAVVLAALLTAVAPVAEVGAGTTPHWIRVRVGPDGRHRELFDTRTGAAFVPRGVNILHDRTFGSFNLDLIVAPGEYDAPWIEEQLTTIERLGYNTIRVFLDLCPGQCLTNPDATPKPEWLDNIAALLTAARDHGLVVLLTSNGLPDDYVAQLPCCDPFHAGFNGQMLSDDGLDLARVYWRQIIGGLLERSAPLEVVLAYELRNESFFDLHLEPLSLTSGLVTGANGVTYDMANPAAKLDLVDDNQIHFADRVRDSIRALDPTALVTMGFFAPDEPWLVRPGDTRLVRTERFMRESSMDFFDLHAYANLDLHLWQIVENFTLDASILQPVIMGEFGSIHPAHADAHVAADALADWMEASCAFGFDGWLSWAWGSLDPSIIKVTEQNLAIAKALAPLVAPDPCSPPPTLPNLAFGRPVIATSELPGEEAARAVDSLAFTQWGSGAPPPAEIVIDLGGPKTLHEVRLLVEQFPAGSTTHRVEVRRPVGGWLLLEKLTGVTASEQWLRVIPSAPIAGVRWIRIKSQKSPSWISWREVQAY